VEQLVSRKLMIFLLRVSDSKPSLTESVNLDEFAVRPPEAYAVAFTGVGPILMLAQHMIRVQAISVEHTDHAHWQLCCKDEGKMCRQLS